MPLKATESFNFIQIVDNNILDVLTCEVGVTLAPLYVLKLCVVIDY
jgi:hypothetical protein